MIGKKIGQKVEQICDVYFKREGKLFYREIDWSGRDLDYILNLFDIIQKPQTTGGGYEELQEVKEKRGSLVYKFTEIPARDSDARRKGLHLKHIYYKVVPRLKLEKDLE